MSDPLRCGGCGELVQPGQNIMSLMEGVAQPDGAIAMGAEFGLLHRECFDRSVQSPRLALARILSMTTPATSSSPVAAKTPRKRKAKDAAADAGS